MNLIFIRSSLFACGAFLFAAGASGVPARRGPLELIQPDGTSVTLRLCGDETFHYFLTEDGYAADRDDEGYFRIVGNDGRLTSLSVSSSGGVETIDRVQALEARRQAALASSQFCRPGEGHDGCRKGMLPASPSKWDNSDGHDIRKFPSVGNQKVLVILVSFADLDWSFSPDPHADMTAMLNEPGFDRFGCTGSARDYFHESSNGIFDPEFDVYGPVILPHDCAFYGERVGFSNDANPARMVLDACAMLDDAVDFSQYDRDGDGLIDNVYIFYAGYGENEGAESWRIWPHAWDVRHSSEEPMTVDGVQVGRYACSNELIYGNDIMAGIGTMCHEFSHVLGLPDLYATNYSGALTPGQYSVMDQGPYNNMGRTPPLYSAYERYALEWQKPVDIIGDARLTVLPLSAHGNTYRHTIDPGRPTEYFLFENRRQEGFDTYLPNHGLLVWHVNFDASFWNSNTVNDNPTDMHVDLIEADGIGGDATSGGDTYPGDAGVFEFLGSDGFANRNGLETSVDLNEITEASDGAVTLLFGDGSQPEPGFIPDPPFMSIEEIGSDYFTVSCHESPEDADDMESEKSVADTDIRISVVAEWFDEDEEAFCSGSVSGYDFIQLPSDGRLRVTGLQPDHAYTVRSYRMSAENVSLPYAANIVTSGQNTASAAPELRMSESGGLAWSAIEGAECYMLTVAERLQDGETETIGTGFDSRRLPGGWDYMGAMSSADGTFGNAAPSLFISENDDYLISDSFDHAVSAVSLWACAAEESPAYLSLYSHMDNGFLYPVGSMRITGEGGRIDFGEIPEGTGRFMITASAGGGNGVYIDDISVLLTHEPEDKPVTGYDGIMTEETSASLSGLENGKEYVAYVRAVKDNKPGRRSNTLEFIGAGAGSVNSVDSQTTCFRIERGNLIPPSDTGRFDVTSLDGRIIAVGHSGPIALPDRGVYLVRFSDRIQKILW